MSSHRLLNGADLHAPTNYYVENDTGVDIPILKVVTFTGIGTFPSIAVYPAGGTPVRGVTMMDIPATSGNNQGFICSLGFLIGVNTSPWPEGTQLYSDASGNLTTTVNLPLVATVYKQDAVNGYLFIEGVSESGGSGGGNVTGIPPTTPGAIASWENNSGTALQNTDTLVQAGGAIQSSGFLTDRSITTLISIPSEYSMIAPELEIEVTGAIQIESDGELIII